MSKNEALALIMGEQLRLRTTGPHTLTDAQLRAALESAYMAGMLGSLVPEVPCPICGGEALGHEDKLERCRFLPSFELRELTPADLEKIREDIRKKLREQEPKNNP